MCTAAGPPRPIVEKYRPDVVVGECFPKYSGLLNLAASWLGGEGLVVEPMATSAAP